jgi:hypothetical protein
MSPFSAGSDPSDIVDVCYPYGSIRVPGGTEPIVLQRDAFFGGRYFILGTVISADKDYIAQMQPQASPVSSRSIGSGARRARSQAHAGANARSTRVIQTHARVIDQRFLQQLKIPPLRRQSCRPARPHYGIAIDRHGSAQTSHKALAAGQDMGMLEAGERQPEVIELVAERFARNRDAEPTHVGEVRQAHPAQRVLLAEDHIAVGAAEGAPHGDATLQSGAPMVAISGWRRHSSSKIATARMPGAASNIGTISFSHTPARGSGAAARAAFASGMAAADRLRSGRRWQC